MASNYRLKAARVFLGLTQLQLAQRVGKKEIDISRIETGRARPEPLTRTRIAEVLQKSAFELFDN